MCKCYETRKTESQTAYHMKINVHKPQLLLLHQSIPGRNGEWPTRVSGALHHQPVCPHLALPACLLTADQGVPLHFTLSGSTNCWSPLPYGVQAAPTVREGAKLRSQSAGHMLNPFLSQLYFPPGGGGGGVEALLGLSFPWFHPSRDISNFRLVKSQGLQQQF